MNDLYVATRKVFSCSKFKIPSSGHDIETMTDNLWSLFGGRDKCANKSVRNGMIKGFSDFTPSMVAWSESVRDKFFAYHRNVIEVYNTASNPLWAKWVLTNMPSIIGKKTTGHIHSPRTRRVLRPSIFMVGNGV